MFIRRTQTRSRTAGQPYVTHRLVQSARVGGSVKQTTRLNLGSHFDLPQNQWPALSQCIDELVHAAGPRCWSRRCPMQARPWRSVTPRS